MIRRRDFLIGAGAAAIARPHRRSAPNRPTIIKMGALKLIHSIAPYFYETLHAGRLQGRGHPVREPDRGQERGRHQVGRFRHVRDRGRDPRRRGRRADRRDRQRLQPRHGGDRQEGQPDRLDQGPARASGSRSGRARRRRCSSSSACAWRACRSRTSRRCASRSARCISRSRAATSTPMSARSPGPGVSLASGIGKLVEYPYGTAMGVAQHDLRRAPRHARRAIRS